MLHGVARAPARAAYQTAIRAATPSSVAPSGANVAGMDSRDRHRGTVRTEDASNPPAAAVRVSGTPTFFVNGRRHYGEYDIGTLSALVRAAGARALAATPAAD